MYNYCGWYNYSRDGRDQVGGTKIWRQPTIPARSDLHVYQPSQTGTTPTLKNYKIYNNVVAVLLVTCKYNLAYEHLLLIL